MTARFSHHPLSPPPGDPARHSDSSFPSVSQCFVLFHVCSQLADIRPPKKPTTTTTKIKQRKRKRKKEKEEKKTHKNTQQQQQQQQQQPTNQPTTTWTAATKTLQSNYCFPFPIHFTLYEITNRSMDNQFSQRSYSINVIQNISLDTIFSPASGPLAPALVLNCSLLFQHGTVA